MPSQDRSLRELFEAVSEQPADDRARYLDVNCPDTVRRAFVERMLEAAAGPASPLPSAPAAALARAMGEPAAAATLPPGSRIGPFELIEVIGEGGSSTVFRAVRDVDGVRQEVALKLLRRGLYSPDAQRQFRRERQILSQLRHPGIARLIEGGVTDTGAAYIALDLVDGMPITDYARTHRVDLRGRLKLFIDVCSAVDAAHRALIVHRDLKPSNVLVTSDGEIKLLDFGIAKLLDADDDTQTRLPAFTPAYASPEQRTGGLITTATDVYALGVLLGELITGERLTEASMRTPSSHVGDQHEPGVSQATAQKTRWRLRGDLNNIVRKALVAEPARRYASAGSFADDIERLLDGRPVKAHPPSRMYRAARFVSRHRAGVLMTAVFLIGIVSALGLVIWQGHVARQSLQRANAMRDFMFSAFAQAEPSVPRDGPPRIDEVVSQAIVTARADSAMNHEVRTELLSELGAVLRGQGQLVPARTILQWNYDQARHDFGDRASVTLDAGHELAASMLVIGDLNESRTLIDDLLGQVAGRDALLEMKIRLDSARLSTLQHEQKRALGDAQSAMQLARRIGTDSALEMALDEYGNVQLQSDEIAGAISTYTELLERHERRFGPTHLLVASAHAYLSRAYRRSGNIAAAESHIRRALAIDTAVLPKDHWRIANHLNALVFVLLMQRDYRGALDAAVEGLRINRLVNGDNNPEVANDLNNVGMLRGYLGDYQGALEPLRQALEITIAKFGPTNFQTAWSQVNHGSALARAGDVPAGVAEIHDAIAMYEANADPDLEMQAIAWEKLARLHLDRGEPSIALPEIDHIDSLLPGIHAPDAAWKERAATLRATALLQQGKPEPAQTLLQVACESLRQTPAADAELPVEIALLRALAAQDLDTLDAATGLANEARKALAALRNPPPRLLALDAALTRSASGSVK